QHHGLARELALEAHELDEFLEADDAVPLLLEVPHLLLEGRGGEDQASLGLPIEVVVAEDRHELIPVRLHPGRVPRARRDDHLIAGREGVAAHVVDDHPGLARIGQVALGQGGCGVAGPGEGDDELVRAEGVRQGLGAGLGGALGLGGGARRGGEGEGADQRPPGGSGQRRPAAHAPSRCQTSSNTSTCSSLPFTLMGPSGTTSTRFRTLSYVRPLMRMRPGLAFDSSREARFTLSPMTVYSMRSPEPTVPATTSPTLTPMPTWIRSLPCLARAAFRTLMPSC